MRQTTLCLNSLVLLCLYEDFLEDLPGGLTLAQWHNLEFRLNHSTLKQPSGLLFAKEDDMMMQLNISQEDAAAIKTRIGHLFDVLSLLAKYEKMGISVITKFEAEYPNVLFDRLKKNAPLILYYTGNYQLLLEPAISIAGPRDVTSKINNNTKAVVKKINEEKYHLMISEHSGCETVALTEQFKRGGCVILFVTSSLVRYRIEYMRQLKDEKMLLISHRRPESSYDVVESVVRNSYIYALCITNFIIRSELNTGSLWFSAMQNLKHRWSKILAIVDDEFYGNAKLVEAGAIPVTMEKVKSSITISQMMEINKQDISVDDNQEQLSIFDYIGENNEEVLNFES